VQDHPHDGASFPGERATFPPAMRSIGHMGGRHWAEGKFTSLKRLSPWPPCPFLGVWNSAVRYGADRLGACDRHDGCRLGEKACQALGGFRQDALVDGVVAVLLGVHPVRVRV